LGTNVDRDSLRRYLKPVTSVVPKLQTGGRRSRSACSQSSLVLAIAPIFAKLAQANPRVEVHTFKGEGHPPHATAPAIFVDVTLAFVRNARELTA
jgi:pimeloyl-ACP methyl ester carboxylesterase